MAAFKAKSHLNGRAAKSKIRNSRSFSGKSTDPKMWGAVYTWAREKCHLDRVSARIIANASTK